MFNNSIKIFLSNQNFFIYIEAGNVYFWVPLRDEPQDRPCGKSYRELGSGCGSVGLVERSLPTPEIRGSNHVIGKFYLQSTLLKTALE